jgi:hypothetical protein
MPCSRPPSPACGPRRAAAQGKFRLFQGEQRVAAHRGNLGSRNTSQLEDASVTRTIFATAALAAATAFASTGAQACISCEYVPEVVRSSSTLPHTGHYYAAEPYQKKARSHGHSYEKRIAKGDGADRPAKTAKAPKAEKAAKVAKTDSTEKPDKPAKVAKAETSSKAEPAQKQAAAKPAQSESSSITVATADVVEKATLQPAGDEPPAKATDCKKFFASVGMTLTVPCE